MSLRYEPSSEPLHIRLPLISQPEPRTPNPETPNTKPETRNQKPETRNPKPYTLNPQPQTLNSKPQGDVTVESPFASFSLTGSNVHPDAMGLYYPYASLEVRVHPPC